MICSIHGLESNDAPRPCCTSQCLLLERAGSPRRLTRMDASSLPNRRTSFLTGPWPWLRQGILAPEGDDLYSICRDFACASLSLCEGDMLVKARTFWRSRIFEKRSEHSKAFLTSKFDSQQRPPPSSAESDIVLSRVLKAISSVRSGTCDPCTDL